jgi:hypothetical protein
VLAQCDVGSLLIKIYLAQRTAIEPTTQQPLCTTKHTTILSPNKKTKKKTKKTKKKKQKKKQKKQKKKKNKKKITKK